VKINTRKMWKAFANTKIDQATDFFVKVLQKTNHRYELDEAQPSFLLGSKSNAKVIKIKEENLRIVIYEATADPLVRLFSGVLGTQQYHQPITFIKVESITQGNNDILRYIMKQFVRTCFTETGKNPWELAHHPRFRMSLILRLITKKKWQAWEFN